MRIRILLSSATLLCCVTVMAAVTASDQKVMEEHARLLGQQERYREKKRLWVEVPADTFSLELPVLHAAHPFFRYLRTHRRPELNGSHVTYYAIEGGRVTRVNAASGLKVPGEFPLFGQMESLQWLIVQLSGLDPAGKARALERIATYPELRTLQFLGEQEWSAEMMNALGAASRIRRLDMGSGSPFGPYAAGLSHMAALEEFYCARCRLDDGVAAHLAAIPRLEVLVIPDNSIGPEGAKALSQASNLRYLDLRSNNIGDEGLAHLVGLTRLTSLDLGSNGIGEEGAIRLAVLKNLEVLKLERGSVGDAGVRSLVTLKKLKVLSLTSNDIGPAGARRLAGLTNLERLSLNRNRLGSGQLEFLKKLPRLRWLHLDGVGLADEDMRVIGTLENLEFVSLMNNPYITSRGYMELKNLKGLKRAQIPDNVLSKQEFADLRNALPECSF